MLEKEGAGRETMGGSLGSEESELESLAAQLGSIRLQIDACEEERKEQAAASARAEDGLAEASAAAEKHRAAWESSVKAAKLAEGEAEGIRAAASASGPPRSHSA
jgi:hypothetical protein